MPEKSPYRIEPVDSVPVYGSDRRTLGTLAQKVISREGDTLYGIIEFAGDHGKVFAPLPWAIMRFDDDAGGYVADVDHLKLLEAPHMKDISAHAFDDDFVDKIDAAYGMEFPGIETLNDFA